MSLLSQRVQSIKPSPTLAVAAKAKEMRAAGRDVIDLGSGEPDFDTPEHIKDAARQALRDGFTKYTAVDGIPELKRAIINKFKVDSGLDYAMDQVVVTVGGKQAFYNMAMAILNAGDEVIIPAPYWVSYPDMTILAEGTPVCVDTSEAEGLKLTPAQLEAAITPRTKLVVINSPSNPCGAAYTKQELVALGEVLLRHPQVLVASDDIYEKIVFDGFKFHTVAEAVPALYDRTIILNGVSKSYSMTGWRIGYAAGPATIIKAMGKIQSQSTSCATSIAQKATVAALTGSQECMQPMLAAFQQRRDFVVQRLNAIPGITCRNPEGAFYVYPNMAGLIGTTTPEGKVIATSLEYSAFLLESQEVALVPGTAFGKDPYFRISFATSLEALERSLERIERSARVLLGK